MQLVWRALDAGGGSAAARDVLAAGVQGLRQSAEAISDGPERGTVLYCVPEHARMLALAVDWSVPTT